MIETERERQTDRNRVRKKISKETDKEKKMHARDREDTQGRIRIILTIYIIRRTLYRERNSGRLERTGERERERERERVRENERGGSHTNRKTY